jgi:hypothetical protein
MSRYARRQSVKAVAARSAGARSASLDAAKAISDLAATRSQLLTRSPRFKTIGKHMPPPAGVKPPALWGTGARITELFGAQASSIQLEQREFVFRYHSAAHWLDVFKTYYGPLLKTFGALDPKAQAALTEDLFALIKRFNRSGDATMVVPSEYIEVVVTRRA